MRSRLAARFYTGPLGHLVAGVADWTGVLARWLWARVRARIRRTGSRR